MRIEQHNLHGDGNHDHEVYDMSPEPGGYWSAVTNVPCPVEGCDQTVVWYEAGYVPGYRVCMAQSGRAADGNRYDIDSLRHRFHASGNADSPTLIRD